MKIKKNGKLIIILISLVLIITLILGIKIKIDKIYENIIKQIENFENEPISNENLDKYIRFMNIFNKKSEKKLLIALEEINDNNLQKAEDILYKNISKSDKYTSTDIKLLNMKELVNIYIKDDKKYEAINLIKNNINKLNSREFEKNLDSILTFIKEVVVPIDVDLAIEIFESNINKYEKLDNNQTLKLLNAERDVYLLNDNYAKASEVTIRSIYIAKKLNYKYYQIESMLDLADILKKIKGDKIVANIIEDTFNIKTNNEDELAKLRVRAILSLCELYLDGGDYEKAQIYLNKIYDYKKYYNEEEFRDTEILFNNMLAELNIHNNNLIEAKRCLDISLNLQKEDDEEYYNKKELSYKLTLALLYEKEENYEEAKKIYKEILLNEYKDYYLYEKVMKRLIKIEDDNNLKNEYIDDLVLLIEYEQEKRYGDYTYNILDKMKYEIKIQQIYKHRLLLYKIILLLGLLSLIFNRRIVKLIRKNNYDVLIPIYNRRYFDKVYKVFLKSKKEFFIIMIDIDNFKIINDTYGHKFGDKVLIDVSKLIKNKLNKNYKLFRYGGEELAIICKKISKDNVIEVAEDIRNSISKMIWKENNIIVTVSMGISSSKETEDPLGEADKRLYVSKNTGKNKITYK